MTNLETIVGIQFCVFSPEEIEKRAVVEITSQATFEGNEPKSGGLFDARMGVLENGKICRSCGQTNHGCPGHFGFYRLTRPVYSIHFVPWIMNVLRCTCIRCGKLKIDKALHASILNRKGEARWREVLAACSTIVQCGQETEDGCGAVQPSKYERQGIARIAAVFHDENDARQDQMLEVEYVHRLFRRITDEDVDFMGLSRHWCRPDWMICTVLPIPPPQVRPSVIQDNNTRSEDDLTHKLMEIVRTNIQLKRQEENGAPQHIINEHTDLLQYHIPTYFDNTVAGLPRTASAIARASRCDQTRSAFSSASGSALSAFAAAFFHVGSNHLAGYSPASAKNEA
jgi:DNA-directed RNA polymerase II subunit RPB1